MVGGKPGGSCTGGAHAGGAGSGARSGAVATNIKSFLAGRTGGMAGGWRVRVTATAMTLPCRASDARNRGAANRRGAPDSTRVSSMVVSGEGLPPR